MRGIPECYPCSLATVSSQCFFCSQCRRPVRAASFKKMTRSWRVFVFLLLNTPNLNVIKKLLSGSTSVSYSTMVMRGQDVFGHGNACLLRRGTAGLPTESYDEEALCERLGALFLELPFSLSVVQRAQQLHSLVQLVGGATQ